MIVSPDPIIADFKKRKLNVDFHEMTLTQNGSGGSAIVYKGKGYIRQTEDDVLTFRLYASQTQNTDAMADFKRLNRIKSGELYPAEAFYTLTGIASDGSSWSAERVLPECGWHFEHPNPIVSGKLSSVTCGELLPDPKAVSMHFFESADLPMIGREAECAAAGCEFRFENDEDGFVVRAKSGEPLPKQFVMRVEETLRFLLAQSVSPRAIVQPHAVILNSATRKTTAIRLGPPISRGSAAFLNGWRLFGVYLTYIVRQTKFENWNPCSGYVHNAQEASANSLDAWAIGLCVAVEGLASMIKLDEDKAEKKKREIEKKRLKKLQEFIVKQVSSRQRLKAFAPRIGGLVGNLHALRAIDRMTWLAKRGGLDRKHIEAWKWLRNRGVHPSAKGDIDIASVDFQEFLDELNRVTVLLYHIVFYLIGYRGPYTDYGLRNFPAGQYTPDGSKNEIADSAT